MADNYEIYDLFVKQADFALTSPSSSNRQVTFRPEGKMDDAEFSEWELISELGVPRLILRKGGNIVCKLYWHSQKWQGRDVRGGMTMVRPIKDPHLWDSLFSVKRNDEKKPELLMRERPSGLVDFQKHAYNLADRFERTKDAAIAIIGCNRPEYFQKVSEAIRANRNHGDYDIFCFLDRPLASHEDRLRKQIASANGDWRQVLHPINFGCGRALIDAREQLFQNMGYERAFIFEDDMVPSDTYLRYCENLLAWGQKNFTNIGAVQGWTKSLMIPQDKLAKQRQVHVTYTNWWGYLMPKKTWDVIRPFMLEYQKLFLMTEYSRRPHRSIVEWFRPKAQANFSTFQGGYIPDANSIEHRRVLFANIPSGQDGATWISFDHAGFVRLAPTVNRGLYIGAYGIHQRPERYKREGFDKMTLDTFPDDGRIKKFEPRTG